MCEGGRARRGGGALGVHDTRRTDGVSDLGTIEPFAFKGDTTFRRIGGGAPTAPECDSLLLTD